VEARQRPLQNAVMCDVYVYTSPCFLRIMPSTPRDMAIISKMGHMITVGLPMLRVRRRNPLDGSELPKATRARDEATQGVAGSWHIRSPIEGTWRPQASYLNLGREVSFTPLCGLALSHPSFPHGLPRKETGNHLVRI
jgi:hypothetical protein